MPKTQMLLRPRAIMKYLLMMAFLASILMLNVAYGFDRSTNVQNPDRCYDRTYPINWSGCHFYGKPIPQDLDYTNANLSYTNLAGAILDNMDFTNATFRGAFLKYAQIDNTDLTNVDFTETQIIRGWVRGSDLTDANLSQGNFLFTDFTGSNFTNAKFHHTTLTYAILASADLYNATFYRSGTWNTNLNNCINHPICE